MTKRITVVLHDGYDGDEGNPVGLRDGTAISWMPLPEPPEKV